MKKTIIITVISILIIIPMIFFGCTSAIVVNGATTTTSSTTTLSSGSTTSTAITGTTSSTTTTVGVGDDRTTTTTTTTATTTTTTTTTSTTTTTAGGGTHGLTNLFFLHHSVGDNIIIQGNVRGVINSYNTVNGTSFVFWDHGYQWDGSYWGLRNPAGTLTHSDYGALTSNTDPVGLEEIFTTTNETRTHIMTHGVIAFKSCYTATQNLCNGWNTVDEYKAFYLSMRNYFDANTNKLFIVVSPPPITSGSANSTNSGRARQFANWLKSTEAGGFLNGTHPNIKCFDLFNYLARPDNGTATANTLQASYESGDESHPNETANIYLGPIFAQFLINSALSY